MPISLIYVVSIFMMLNKILVGSLFNFCIGPSEGTETKSVSLPMLMLSAYYAWVFFRCWIFLLKKRKPIVSGYMTAIIFFNCFFLNLSACSSNLQLMPVFVIGIRYRFIYFILHVVFYSAPILLGVFLFHLIEPFIFICVIRFSLCTHWNFVISVFFIKI